MIHLLFVDLLLWRILQKSMLVLNNN